MTDGPFKNLKLDSRSRRFAEAVQNEAEDHDRRCALGSDAIVNGILSGNDGLISDLQSYREDGQLDLDPRGLTQPPDPGRELVESVRLSFWVDVGGQGPVSGAGA